MAGSIPAQHVRRLTLEVRMSKPPLPEAAVAMLRKPNPAVITTLRRDGQPVSTATWYLWDDGRVLVNMDEGRSVWSTCATIHGSPWTAGTAGAH
jgi:hypothetical protein